MGKHKHRGNFHKSDSGLWLLDQTMPRSPFDAYRPDPWRYIRRDCCQTCTEFSDPFTTPQWQPSTYYSSKNVAPTTFNGHYYRSTNRGTSQATEPSWPTSGGTVSDGPDLVWQDKGAKWTVNAGTWQSSATGVSTSDSDAKIMANIGRWRNKDRTTDTDFHPHVIKVTLTVRYGSTSRVWFAAGYVEIVWSNCCRVNIYDSSGNLLAVSPKISVADGAKYTLQVCITATTVTAAGCSASLDSTTIAAGVGTGTVSGTVGFAAFSIQRHKTPPWQSNTAYGVGDVVLPTAGNKHAYKCTSAGTSGTTEPTWPIDGTTVTDGGITWIDWGNNDDSNCPGCTADPCTVFSDDFACDDTTSAWSVKSGSWSASGGTLSTSSSNALIIADVPWADDPSGFHTYGIQVSMTAVTGNYSRIIFSYNGGSYNYVEVYWNGVSSTVSIKTSGGSTLATSAMQNFVNGVVCSFTVYVTANSAVVVIPGQPTAIVGAEVTSTATGGGVGTGNVLAPATFSSFLINACLAYCPNACFKEVLTHTEFAIIISGATDSAAIFNGTWIANVNYPYCGELGVTTPGNLCAGIQVQASPFHDILFGIGCGPTLAAQMQVQARGRSSYYYDLLNFLLVLPSSCDGTTVFSLPRVYGPAGTCVVTQL